MIRLYPFKYKSGPKDQFVAYNNNKCDGFGLEWTVFYWRQKNEYVLIV